MSSGHQFLKAPVISKSPRQGLRVEGVAYPEDVDLFQRAVDEFSHLLGQEPMTGGQWLRQIGRAYALEEPRLMAMADAIRKVMLVGQFDDEDYDSVRAAMLSKAATDLEILSDASGAAAQIVGLPAHRAQELVDAGKAFRHSFVDLPREDMGTVYVVHLLGQSENSLVARIHRLLKKVLVPQAGKGDFSYTHYQDTDTEAVLALIPLLMHYQGYSFLMGMFNTHKDVASGMAPEFLEPEQSVRRFFRTMFEMEWTGERPIYLSRPGTILGTLPQLREYECMVSGIGPNYVSWMMPLGVAHDLLDQARQELAAEYRHHLTERAI